MFNRRFKCDVNNKLRIQEDKVYDIADGLDTQIEELNQKLSLLAAHSHLEFKYVPSHIEIVKK